MDNLEVSKDPRFLWRRFLEPMADWMVFVPILFALFLIALLIMFTPREKRLRFLAWAGGMFVLFTAVYLPLAFLLRDAFSWLVVVVPIILTALVYVSLMYVKDSRSIHPAWAGFLGFLRCCVYGILTLVFFLPGCQNFETSHTPSKVVFVFDVSRSMDEVDREPTPGVKGEVNLTRKQQVVRLLKSPRKIGEIEKNMLQMVLEKSPLTIYRCGGKVDEKAVHTFTTYADAANFDWDEWLNPDPDKIPEAKIVEKEGMTEDDKSKALKKALEEVTTRRNDLVNLLEGTNLYGALDKISNLERTSYLQSIVLFSDGHSNSGSEDTLREFFSRMEKPNPPINVFTIGVGENRQKVKVEFAELISPTELRPDDKFPVRAIIVGENLEGEKAGVTVELTRIKDKDGKVVTDKVYTLPAKDGKFKGGGDFPREQFEWEVDLKELSGLKKTDESSLDPLEGTWKITARTPKHPKENFKEDFHVETSEFSVIGKKLRVLLVSSGPLRDYQFVRTLFYRESVEKRLEFCVHLQTGVGSDNIDQDVEPERLLHKFPDRLGAPTKDDPYGTLSAFDVVIAFDVDWTLMQPSQLKLLKKWVGNESGGLIFVAGPMNTFLLAKTDVADVTGMQSLKTLVPVSVEDSRLHALKAGHDVSRPYLLKFEPVVTTSKEFDFLKLDDAEEGPLAGWEKFFWGAAAKADPLKDQPLRGFHWYYPVKDIKPGATVLATFSGPPESRIKINEKDSDQPFIVTMKYGSGKTVYIGSAETWRLRQAKEVFHDRFWVNVSRFASSGVTQKKQFGRMLAPTRAVAGKFTFDAQIKGEDMLPLPKTARPIVEVRKKEKFGEARPVKYDLKPKLIGGEWAGWFEGTVDLKEEADYELKIPVPGSKEYLEPHIVKVKLPNLEKDNVRINFPALYAMATEASPLINKLEGDTIKDLKSRLTVPAGAGGVSKTTGSASERLFLPITQADTLPDLIRSIPPKPATVKGALQDLWDGGLKTGWSVNSAWLGVLIPIGVGLLGLGILMFLGQYFNGAMFAASFTVLGLIVGAFWLVSRPWPDLDVDFSFVLVLVVSLLGIEWLTRKLLKLA